ncbi:hypothetical protein [Paludibaculum fermentans]|uniref:Uncharacterized protein n=1 Tax=Paludibaculum fermentans TaxID=1473598 RepID=A0A7S7NN38_PALFE|nr:hypothetical protein [Paludibaculum fermentans]QOY86645.1 hypothetical protein IRI77_28220 [Paludibaculum fermentans]
MRDGRLILFILGALGIAYAVFGALHDIASGRQDSYWLEYAFLILSLPATTLLHWHAVQTLPARERLVWLLTASALLALFCLAAATASVRPKHTNDAAVGSALLVIGIPLLAVVGRQLTRAASGPHEKAAD